MSSLSPSVLVSKSPARRLGPVVIGAALLIVAVWAIVRQPAAERATLAPPATPVALSPSEMLAILMRSTTGANDTSLDVLYAPPWYFEWNHRAPPATDRPALVFYLFENIHTSTLAPELPTAVLDVDGRQFEPLSVTLYSEAPHHRISQVLFAALDPTGAPLLTDRTRRLSLILPTEGVMSAGSTVTWDLPLPYGAGAVGAASTPPAAMGQLGLTWASFLAILGGMLTALSPCLLQLTAYYAATLAGTGAELAATPDPLPRARSGLIKTALFFVAGFVVVYTIGGAAAGYVGQSLQRLGNFGPWLRPIGIAAGIVIILLAVRTAARARVPLVCRLPVFRPTTGPTTGVLASALMGLSFAVGCLSCFSATVLSALLLYAGATGSPLTGAALLFVFSLGIGLVFLLAALLAAEALPLLTFLNRAQPVIGLISAAIMAGFGILMITNSFHVVSGFLFRLFYPG
jgi:cytochrome c-type biogenesis protein